ncbi:MAG: AsmA family protein [Gammaproteobacteria bacterium]|nr:AsmA family protein [Gammaproteobacteria bacterium]
MKILFKIVAGILLVMVLLVAAAAAYLKFFFDPNDLRDQLTQQVQSRIGRELVIEGDFSVNVFPWFAVNVGQTRLSDDPAFSKDPLLQFDNASASIKLRPLFKKQIELGTTTIEGLSLSLIRKADGTTNWEAFMAALESDEPAKEEAPSDKPGFAARSLGAVNVIDANIRFTDETINDTLVVSQFNLRTGELVPGQPFDVDLSTLLKASDAAMEVALTGQTQFTETQVDISRLDASFKGNHSAVPFDSFDVTVTSDGASIGETTATLAAPTVNWQMTGGREAAATVRSTTGTLSAQNLSRDGTTTQVAAPVLAFQAAVNNDSVSELNGEFSAGTLTVRNDSELQMPSPTFDGVIEGPGIPDKSQKLKISGQQLNVNIDKGTLQFAGLDFAGMGLQVRGSADVTSMFADSPRVNAPLQISEFNLRNLMAKLDIPLETSDASALTKVGGAATVRMDGAGLHLDKLNAKMDQSTLTGNISVGETGQKMTLNIDVINADRYLPPPDESQAGSREVDEVEIPAQTLRELNINGTFTIGQLTLTGMESKDIEVKVVADKGNVRVHPARASMYGGTYSGDIRIDARGEVPVLSLNERFDNVDIGALSMDMADTDRVTGRLTGALTMTARGHNTSELKATSSGTTSFSITNGVLEGVNIMETVRNIVSLANKEGLTPDQPDRTEFRKLAGTAKITNGVLNNNDLTVEIPLLRVTGGGTVNLNNKAIDYKIGTRVVQEGDVPLEKELQYLSDYTLPVFISGTYDAPVIDKTASVADLVKQYAKKRVKDEIFGRIGLGTKPPATTGEGSTPPATVEDAVKDRLKDLLGGKKKPSATPAPSPETAPADADTAATDPEAEPPAEEEPEESPEDAVKNALKDLLGGN